MKNFIISILVFCASYSVTQAKTLFMTDHSSTACPRKDHKKEISPEEFDDVIVSKNLSELASLVAVQLTKIVQNSTAQTSKQKMIIFDIDETVLTEKSQTGMHWSKKQLSPILPMQKLYQACITQNIPIAFVTWRIETEEHRTKTVQDLATNGFGTFHSLYLRPKDWKGSCAAYKEYVRNLLAQDFDIVATLDDLLDNLKGANTGDMAIWICKHIQQQVKTPVVKMIPQKGQMLSRKIQCFR